MNICNNYLILLMVFTVTTCQSKCEPIKSNIKMPPEAVNQNETKKVLTEGKASVAEKMPDNEDEDDIWWSYEITNKSADAIGSFVVSITHEGKLVVEETYHYKKCPGVGGAVISVIMSSAIYEPSRYSVRPNFRKTHIDFDFTSMKTIDGQSESQKAQFRVTYGEDTEYKKGNYVYSIKWMLRPSGIDQSKAVDMGRDAHKGVEKAQRDRPE